jgi:hypothetical protein
MISDPVLSSNKVSRLKCLLEEADRTGDMTPLVNELASDAIFKVTIPDGTPVSGEFRGKEAIATYFAEILPAVADFK